MLEGCDFKFRQMSSNDGQGIMLDITRIIAYPNDRKNHSLQFFMNRECRSSNMLSFGIEISNHEIENGYYWLSNHTQLQYIKDLDTFFCGPCLPSEYLIQRNIHSSEKLNTNHTIRNDNTHHSVGNSLVSVSDIHANHVSHQSLVPSKKTNKHSKINRKIQFLAYGVTCCDIIVKRGTWIKYGPFIKQKAIPKQTFNILQRAAKNGLTHLNLLFFVCVCVCVCFFAYVICVFVCTV